MIKVSEASKSEVSEQLLQSQSISNTEEKYLFKICSEIDIFY